MLFAGVVHGKETRGNERQDHSGTQIISQISRLGLNVKKGKPQLQPIMLVFGKNPAFLQKHDYRDRGIKRQYKYSV